MRRISQRIWLFEEQHGSPAWAAVTPVEQLAHSASQAQVDDTNGLDTNVTSQNTGSNTVIIFLSRPMPIRHPWEQLVHSFDFPPQTGGWRFPSRLRRFTVNMARVLNSLCFIDSIFAMIQKRLTQPVRLLLIALVVAPALTVASHAATPRVAIHVLVAAFPDCSCGCKASWSEAHSKWVET